MCTTIATLTGYELLIVPRARYEIRRWAGVAASASPPRLREHAIGAIVTDADNAIAISALAATAPRRHQRSRAVALLVAFQVLIDYIDRLGERICPGRITANVALGQALPAALAPPSEPLGFEPLTDDDRYLVWLVTECRQLLWRLPAAAVVAPAARAAAVRCAEALAYSHHAAATGTTDELRRWTAAQAGADGYAWWEVAAGGVSNMAVSALLAAAADPSTTERDVEAIVNAYWPHVCVLSTILDSAIDRERDAASRDISYVSHYPSRAAARAGMIAAAERSLAAVRGLPRARTHAMIVCGIACHYAAGAAPGSFASAILPDVVERLRPTTTPIALALRAKRRLSRHRR